MGGQDKGLVEWQEKPLIAYLHATARPLTDDLIISCNRNQQRYAEYADRLVTDSDTSFPGPLAGIRAALQVARHRWLLVLPCDTPGVDGALIKALLRRAKDSGGPCMLRQDGQWQPLVSVLPCTIKDALEAAWQDGDRSPLRFLLQQGAQALDCAADDPRLANLNTPQLLQQR